MIRYQLRCREAHEFEGWFASSGGFDRQNAAGLVSCPACGTSEVTRALMAPSVRTRAVTASVTPEEKAAASSGSAGSGGEARPVAASGRFPDGVRALLSRMRETIERDCDYVGGSFATEATRMHRGEVESRAIYGEATESEREALADEGIAVTRIPWLPRADS